MIAQSAAPAQPASAGPRIAWVPPPGGFLGLSLLIGLLRILTLGIYHFWGKTEVRQRIWSAVRIDGEPLEYRGTGGELFRGFLIVFFVILLPLGLLSFLVPLYLRGPGGRGAYELGFWALLFVLSGFGIHRARRYRLSRTRWRGIRGGLQGRSAPFAWTYLWTLALVPLTLGWIVPWRAARLQRALFNETHFGDKAFVFTGRAGPLYRRYWLVWLSAIVLFVGTFVAIAMIVGVTMPLRPIPPGSITPGKVAGIVAIVIGAMFLYALIRAWYSSGMLNYFARETRFQGASFTLRATAPSLIWLTATNFLLRVLSLGFLSPIADARSMRYMVDRLSIEGSIPWPQIGQNPDALLKRGEGLAEAFNVDAF